MTSIFHDEADAGPDLTVPRKIGIISAGLGFCLSFVFEFVAISNSRNSTAAVGFIFLPFFAALVAIPAFGIGWCLGYFLTWRRSRTRRRRISAFAAALVPLLIALWLIRVLWSGGNLTRQVRQIQTMGGAELERVLAQPVLARNKFILGAIAQNPKADASVLHRIAMSDLPELYEPMGSYFDVMGSNTHGLAVMRLVARNANTASEDLERLAECRNEYVLGDVAANPKLSEGTLRRLARHGDYPVELGLGLNSQTPKDVLTVLAMRADEETRARVAANANAPAEALSTLSNDQAWRIRVSVARNPATCHSVMYRLLEDSDARVRAAARATLSLLPTR